MVPPGAGFGKIPGVGFPVGVFTAVAVFVTVGLAVDVKVAAITVKLDELEVTWFPP